MFRTSVFLRTADCKRGRGEQSAHCYFLSGRNGSYDFKEKYSTLFSLTLVRTTTVFFNKTYGKTFTAYDEFHIPNGQKQRHFITTEIQLPYRTRIHSQEDPKYKEEYEFIETHQILVNAISS
jgi:hypothetical protein